MNTKLRLLIRATLTATAIAVVASVFLSKPWPASASREPKFPTYTTGNFTFSNPVEMVRPTSPAFFQQGGEPEVKTDIFGNIYVTAIQGVPGGVDLWKSIDKGATFVFMGQPDGAQDHCPTLPQCNGLGGGDDQIDISSDGYLYVSSLWIGNVTMSASYDGGTGGVLPGQKWEVNPAAAGVASDDRQWVAAYGPQTVYMTYAATALTRPPGGIGLFITKSTDGGKTFGVPVEITAATALDTVNVEGNLVVDPYTGNVYTCYIPLNQNNVIKLASSTDGGATWVVTTAYTGPAGSTNRGVFPIMAIDRGGNLHLTFTKSDDNATHTNCHVFLTSTANPSAASPTWTSAVQVDNSGGATGTACQAWVVGGSPGVADVTWLGSTATSPNTAPFNWHVYFAQVTNALTGSPTIASNQAESAQIHDAAICFSGGACASGTRTMLEYYVMAIDSSGNANIAYPDSVNNCPAATCETNAWFTKQTGGPSGYSPPAPPPPATFAANLSVTGSSNAAEPSIAVDSHNCIYGSAPGTYFWASEDAGKTFRNTTVPPVLGGGDEDVATIPLQTGARNDSLYYADLVLADIGIFKSTDRGMTWTVPGTGGVAGNFDVSSDRQWISGDRINNGANQILWELDHEFVSEQVRISASIDDSPWGTTTAEVDPTLNAGSTPNTNPGCVFVDKTTHNMYGVFAASNPTTNGIEGGFGKEPDYWEVIASPPAAGGLPPANVTNYPIVKGLIDSPTTAPTPPPGTTTYGTHIGAIFPAAAADKAGNIYAVWTTCHARPNASIPPGTNNANTYDVWFASSHDHGKNFYGPFKISSGVGTSVFPWIDAGDDGRVDVVWYQSPNPAPPLISDPQSPATLTGGPNQMPAGSTWTVVFAQSLNAASREPVFALTTASDHIIHTGSISIGGTFGNSDRSLLDYFKVAIGPDGLANIMNADNGTTSLHINYIRQTGGPLALANPSAVTCLPIPSLTAVVSRMTHGSVGNFDVNLPLIGTRGVEPRSSGSLGAGNYKLVFTFANNVTSCGTASVSTGTGSVSSTVAGPNANQCTVNLTGVSNAQYIAVTFNTVVDVAGNNGPVVGPQMGVLIGDTTANGTVNSSDVAQTQSQSGQPVTATNFREDVTANGSINSSDVALVQSKSGTALPTMP